MNSSETLFASEYLAAERLERLDHDAELRRCLHEVLPARTAREQLADRLIALALWLAPQRGLQARRSQVASLTS
ncbi:MAG TPA: hypothetical protein VFU78_16820 [Thermomicrobiales bacterium]|jgi:hypothetical protein|nr:hypothetical protein [Thermomicrobiales bacterium]